MKRVATMQLNKEATTLRVSVPKDISSGELAHLNSKIVEGVIKNHTGCSCLSGQISVLLESDWQQVVEVELARTAAQ